MIKGNIQYTWDQQVVDSHVGPLKDLRVEETEMVKGFILMPCGRAVIGGMT